MVMNERIQNLKDKIWTEEYWTNPNTDKLLPAQLNKFAELIVQEFANIVQEEIKLVEEFKSTAIKADVIKCHQSKIWHFHKLIDKSKKHFGVEE
jgi:hypothetical protein